MKSYIISKVEITPAYLSVDRKKHRHKYYLYPTPSNLQDLGITSHWSYKDGRRGAVRFTDKRQAQAIAKRHNAVVEEA